MTRRKDDRTNDLFEIPQPVNLTGGLDFRSVVSGLVGDAMKASPKDRFQLAAEMSRLAGREVTKYMLDGYSAEGREEFNLPFYVVPAFETACGTHALTSWLASVRGGRLLIGREALTADLGRLEQIRDEAAKQIRDIKRRLGEQE